MENKDLLQRLNKLGFPLLDVNHDLQAMETISELIKSDDIRLWEGFPVVLANVCKDRFFDISRIRKLLRNKKDYDKFYFLFLVAVALYKFLDLKTSWVNELYDNLKLADKEKVKEFLDNFKNNNELFIHKKHLAPERLKNVFNNYFYRQESNVEKIENNYEELSFEYAMSQIFTVRQKEIFLKRAHGKKMTKTEREYFYRVVKKKAIALANKDLHLLAQKVVV